ncbi:MAG: PDZ domain-containing protein [Chloroflexi bacterium]|nr:PDZ domain-containing protein [Chloroflexota bacterium]
MMKQRNQLMLLFGLFALILSGCAGLVAQADVVESQTIEMPAEEAVVVETAVSAPELAAPVESAPVTALPAQSGPVNGFEAVQAQQQAFIDLYTRTNPAVVNISTNGGEGSGFVYDLQGHIVTNNHVVEGSRQVKVTFSDGTELNAAVIGTAPSSDLAVVQVDASKVNLTAVSLADSDALQVGQIVIAIGSPFGLQNTMTTGIISALDRLFPSETGTNGGQFNIPNVIQTDAAVNPGNSGGPLLDIYGNVIGVNTAIQSPVRGSSGIGLAVPANIVNSVVPQLITGGTVRTPWLGIAGGKLTPELANQLGLNEDQTGILISEVVANGPANAAGLRGGNPATGLGGDIIVAVDGQSMPAIDDLLGYLVQDTLVGQTIQVDLLRDGQLVTVAVTLGERPSS